MRDDRLFKVVHTGTLEEWTDEELENYAKRETCLVFCDITGFFVDEYCDLWLADSCDNLEMLPPDKFQLVWLPRDGSPDTVVYNTHEYRRVS